MRPVTLGSPRGQDDFYKWALGAFRQIEQASNDTLTDDASSSGAALATCAGATADEIAYFTDETHTAFTALTPLARTLLADTTAAAMLATLGAAGAGSYLVVTNNLNDVQSASSSRSNLGLGTAATHASTDFLLAADNLSDVPTPATARSNLGLGTAATHAATDFLLVSNNLSEVTPATARSNLAAAAKTQTEFVTGGIWGTTGNNTYPIIQNIPFGATITQFTALVLSGTVTATLNINSTPVTTGAINLNKGSQTVTPSAANVMVATDTLKIVTSSSSSGNTLLWLVAYTRALA